MKILKQTTSRCSQCNDLVPGRVMVDAMGPREMVWLMRVCPIHGEESFRLSNDARLYHEAAGPDLGGCCNRTQPATCSGTPGFLGANQSAATPDDLASCVTLIEITQGCNMPCNTCFADAVLHHTSEHHMTFDRFREVVSNVLENKGELEILQLSGGEPTVHPEFIRFVEWAAAEPRILCVLINTNGIKLAGDKVMVAELARIEEATDKLHIYLQFDGVEEGGQVELRNRDFRSLRVKALDACRAAKLPVTLAMTVNHANLSGLWAAMAFALKREEVHGISYQPEFFSGRNAMRGTTHLPEPISVADVVTALCDQSKRLTFEDFTPTPCGHPMCQWIGWLGKTPLGFVTPREMGLNLPELQSKVGNRIRYDVKDLVNCQCDSTELGKFIHEMEGLVQQTKAFRIFIKPFMDARSWDEDRIARCCTHVIRPDGKLDSFCRYYADRGAGKAQKRTLDFRSEPVTA